MCFPFDLFEEIIYEIINEFKVEFYILLQSTIDALKNLWV